MAERTECIELWHNGPAHRMTRKPTKPKVLAPAALVPRLPWSCATPGAWQELSRCCESALRWPFPCFHSCLPNPWLLVCPPYSSALSPAGPLKFEQLPDPDPSLSPPGKKTATRIYVLCALSTSCKLNFTADTAGTTVTPSSFGCWEICANTA